MEIFLKVKATSNIKRLKVLNNHDLLAFQVIWLGCFKFQQFLAPEMGVKQPVLEVIYMILGIGADDVFILYDAWLQSAHVEGVKVQLLFGVGGCEFPWIQKPRSFANIFWENIHFWCSSVVTVAQNTFSVHIFPTPRPEISCGRLSWSIALHGLTANLLWPCRLDQRNQMQHAAREVKSNAVNGELLMCIWFGEYPLSGGHFGWKKTHMVRWSLNKGAVWGRVSHLHRERWGEVWHCSNCEIWHSIKCLYQGSLVVVVTNGCCSW